MAVRNIAAPVVSTFLFPGCAGISFWAVGYALSFGEDPSWWGNVFIGRRYWFAWDVAESQYAHWFFQYVFAATASTIVSGALAERCEFNAYLMYSFVITGSSPQTKCLLHTPVFL